MTSVSEAFAAFQADAAQYPAAVGIWMRVMGISYVSGLIFAWRYPRALWIVAAAALTFGGLILVKMIDPTIPRGVSGAWIHLLSWPVLLVLVWWRQPLWAGPGFAAVYSIWRIWASVLMLISLVLDFWTVI